MKRAGTKYFAIRAVISALRSPRGAKDSPGVEFFVWSGQQERCLYCKVLPNGPDSVIDASVVVGGVPGTDLLVELIE